MCNAYAYILGIWYIPVHDILYIILYIIPITT